MRGMMRAAVVLAVVSVAQASVTTPMALPALADYAGQVIVGEVAQVDAYWAENPRRIETRVTFRDVTYLKGQRADDGTTFALVVPGGTVGEWTARIADTPEFRPQERWVLMLLPQYRTYPVVGLTQGAFRVQTDAGGTARVYSADGAAIQRIDERGWVQQVQLPRTPAAARLRDADGLTVRDEAAPVVAAPAVTLDAFVTQLQPILDASRQHVLRSPAGQPIPTKLHAVPLQARDGARGVDTARLEAARNAVTRANAAAERTAKEADAPPVTPAPTDTPKSDDDATATGRAAA